MDIQDGVRRVVQGMIEKVKRSRISW